MKKALYIFLATIVLLLCFSLFAENDSTTKRSNAYSKVFVIGKIWSHRLGYRIDYFNSKMEIKQLYIPIEFFLGTNAKARLIYGSGPEYPYMTVTWVDGVLARIAIYGFDSPSALSWGVLSSTYDYSKEFAVTELKISF